MLSGSVIPTSDDIEPSSCDTFEPRSRFAGLITSRRIGITLISAQFVALVAFSVVLYQHFDLSQDYAQYTQAWYAIAHGNFNPYDSVFHYPFWQNSGEFVLWPLALLYFVFPHGIDLLIVQDLAIVATELVAFSWAIEILRTAGPSIAPRTIATATVAVALALVIDPWAYNTAMYDFHTEPLAAFFVILAARDLWRGHHRRLPWWVIGALACNALAGLYLAAIGVSGLWTRCGRRRISAAFVIIVGLIWLIAFSSLTNHIGGAYADSTYGYLLTHPNAHSSLLDVAIGVFTHLHTVFVRIADRWLLLVFYLGSVGIVGAISPWGFPTIIAVFLPSILASSALFSLFISFQQWPALPITLVATVMVFVGLLTRRLGRIVARAAITCVVILGLFVGILELPVAITHWMTVTPGSAKTLAHLRDTIPPSAEVISSQGISGRFDDRAKIETFAKADQTIPITSGFVVFIITATEGAFEPSKSSTRLALIAIEHFGAHETFKGNGIDVFVWHPHHQRHIVLP